MPIFRVGKPRTTVYCTAAQVIAAAGTSVVWDGQENSDGGPIWPVASAYELTIDRSGFWLFTASAWLGAVATNRLVRMTLNRSGDEQASVTAFRQPAAWSLALSAACYCSAGDDIQLVLYGLTGGTFTLDNTQPRSAQLSALRIAPKKWT